MYVWAPEEEGHFQPGRCSRWWLHQSLKAFEADLRALGTSMVYRRSNESRSALVQLVQETGAQVTASPQLPHRAWCWLPAACSIAGWLWQTLPPTSAQAWQCAGAGTHDGACWGTLCNQGVGQGPAAVAVKQRCVMLPALLPHMQLGSRQQDWRLHTQRSCTAARPMQRLGRALLSGE